MSRSDELFERAQRSIPGGVNSPVRAFRAVGGTPRFMARAQGAYVWDADGTRYIDYLASWGPCILGHAHPEVLGAIAEAASQGTTFGAPTEREVEFAEALREAIPSLQKVRCVSSGTEATMSALRLARGFTGRNQIVKVDGAYHGHSDSLLVGAGSGIATLGVPDSAGVPPGAIADTISIPWNDLGAAQSILRRKQHEVAALIVEPVPGNMGVVPPTEGYLQGLRSLCTETGIVLVFDEVITGFRVAHGGAQTLYGVTPDLTCLGKIIGGGLPAAAFGGRAEIMDKLAPGGPVYQAGTLSGNPLAMAAGGKTLEILGRPGVYERLEKLAARLETGLRKVAAGQAVLQRVGSMMTLFFTHAPVTDYASAKRADSARYGRFFHALLAQGIYFPPSQFESLFVSLAHTEADIDATVAAAAEAME